MFLAETWGNCHRVGGCATSRHMLSDKCELVSVLAAGRLSGGAELPPLGESGGSVGLEVLTTGEAAILVEVLKTEEWTAAKS